MKHTECKDCELGNGDCGHHFKSEIYSNTGITTNYDIASLSACDQYGNCYFFKSKAKSQGDTISREALKKELNSRMFQDDYTTTLLLSSFNDMIDNAPTVDERPQGDLKSCEALKAYARKVLCGDNPTNSLLIRMFDEIIDKAPAVDERPQDEV